MIMVPAADINLNNARESFAVVLLHGLCSTRDEMLALHAALRVAGYAVEHLTIEGYSFDKKVAVQKASSYRLWLDAVEVRVNELRAAHRGVILVGLSAGSSLILGAALRCSAQLDGLVLLSTCLIKDGWAIPKYRFLLPLALYTPVGRLWKFKESSPYGVKNERVRKWIAHQLQQRSISSAGAATISVSHLREYDKLVRHIRRRMTECELPPVLAIHAREDEMAGTSNIELLTRNIRTSSFRTLILGNSYHMITLDNDRRLVVQETLEFINRTASELDRQF